MIHEDNKPPTSTQSIESNEKLLDQGSMVCTPLELDDTAIATEAESSNSSVDDVVAAVDDVDDDNDEDGDAVENEKLDAAFQTVIQNFKNLYDTAKATAGGSALDSAELFDNVFAKSLERSLNGERCGGYNQVLEDELRWLDNDEFIFRAFRFKRIGPNSFDFFVRFTSEEEELIIQSVATFDFVQDTESGDQLTPKVVKLETRRLQQRKKLPGQISASAVWQIWPGLLERDFAAKVYPLPLEVGHKLLLSSNETRLGKPVIEKHEMIRLFLKRDTIHSTVSGPTSRRARHAVQGKEKTVIRLLDERNVPYADGAYLKTMKQTRLRSSVRTSLTVKLCDSAGDPVALCVREGQSVLGNAYFTFMIYSCEEPHRSRTGHYEPAPSVTDELNNQYHAWFRVQIHKDDPELRFVYVWNPEMQDFEMLLKVIEPPSATKQPARSSVAAHNSQHDEPQRTSTTHMPDALHTASSASSHSKSLGLQLCDTSTTARNNSNKLQDLYAVFSKCMETHEAEILIAPGVDPAMVLTISACLNQLKLDPKRSSLRV